MASQIQHVPSILIVDDNKENLILLEAIIKPLNINLIQAFSGYDALEKAKETELLLALIDVVMPGMDGFELAMKLNKERPGCNVPVILITANYFESDIVLKGYNSGAIDFIFKPINHIVLRSKIQIFVELFNQKQSVINNSVLLEKSANELIAVNKAISRSRKKYQNYIDNAPDGVFVTDKTGRYLEVNKAASQVTGFSKQALLKMSLLDLFPEESVKECLEFFETVKNSGSSKVDLVFRHKDESRRWCHIVAVRLSKTTFLGFVKDITKRKLAEIALENSLEQLHQLTDYIEKVREEERVAISRDLHDDLGQALTAVKIDLAIIKRQVKDEAVVLKINNVSALISETIKTVQRITSELRPQIIDDLGLTSAIEWHTQEFVSRNEIEVFLDIDPDISISADVSLALFRIMQEALTNISRHANATRVDIGLNISGNGIEFWISDNGIGISDGQLKSKTSFGILSMTERVTSLGGTLEIRKGNEKGTIIRLHLPI